MNCCVPSCNLDVHVTKHQFSWQVICAALGIASVSEGELDLPLCASHYQLDYRLCNPEKVQICKSCGTKQKCVYHESAAATAGKCFLPCPEPQRVELFLKETTQFEGCLREGDLVCSQCYRYFTGLMKLDVCTLSSEAVVKELKHKQKLFEETVFNFKGFIGYTALHLCKVVSSS